MILEVLQQVLGEFFVDVQERNVAFYHGDLFEASHFKLSDVFLKTSLINSLQLPFELAAGYIGNVKVEGLVGAVAGWPLDVSINDICLVLRPKQVEWENELLMRYAKELVIAIWQIFLAPSVAKKGSTSLISPAKWISGRIQAAGADTTIQLERIHFRVESERSGTFVAYGLYIPLIRFAPRALEEQILYRRQQPGVVYPKASDEATSKLLTLENVSLYTDLKANAYWTPPSEAEIASSTTDNVSSQPYLKEPLARFRDRVLEPFARDPRCELIFVRVIWIKLDFGRKPSGGGEQELISSVLAAVDIVTEEIEMKLNFTQIAVILDELEHVVNHFKRARMLQWRPSCIDREHQEPPSVKVSTNSLLPLPPVTSLDLDSITFSSDKHCKSKYWFREMWKYAFRCVVEQHKQAKGVREGKSVKKVKPKQWWHQNGDENDKEETEYQEMRRQRYIHLYARRLNPAAMEIILHGRGKHLLGIFQQVKAAEVGKGHSPPSSPRKQLPEFEPLTLEEQWEFSDFLLAMSVYEQRVCRALAERELRRDFSAAPPSPTRKLSTPIEFPLAPAETTPDQPRSYSVDSMSTPPKSRSASVSPDFFIDQRLLTRGATIGPSEPGDRLHQQSSQMESPPSRPHAASTSQLPSSTKHESAQRINSLRAWVHKQRDLGLLTEAWLEKQCFPAWLLDSSRCIPLFNWQLGPMTVRFSEGDWVQAEMTKRNAYIELGVESCGGAMLLSRKPVLRLLVEMRVGLFHATLVSQPRCRDGEDESRSTITEYKWISGDFIRTPEDGFFYIGLRYSGYEVAAKPTGRVQFTNYTNEEWSLKGRVCIGPIRIECNEAAMRAAMGQSIAAEMRVSGVDISTPTHFSVLCDTYRTFLRLAAHLPKRKRAKERPSADRSNATTKASVSGAATTSETASDQQRLQRQAKIARLMHVLLLRSSTFEVEVGSLELDVSAYTSHIDQALHIRFPKGSEDKAPEPREDINVMIPMTTYRLQNRPSMNECLVDVAGARVIYRSTKQGRAAVIRHISQFLKL